MKERKLIRIISPITVGVFALLDIAVIYFGFISISKIRETVSALTILFIVLEIFAIVIAILVNKEILSNGIVFYDDEIEFTGLDTNNTVPYDKIACVKVFKDNSASLTKNFNDRHTVIYLTLFDGEALSINVGITTNRLIKKLKKEILAKMPEAEMIIDIKTKPDRKKMHK